ncbi:MAG TPA: FtsH protease activity modulator HflK [Bryobacteraceae bacterium]|nr:FtsH protease activity modulator HflK [Bryobacteraceae bacterium]
MDDRRERIRYYLFAAIVGALLALNGLGIFRTVLGIDTAVFITLLAGYKTFYNSISALLERRISADIALCVAVIAALAVGQYLAAAEAMFIVLVGEGLESYAAGRTEAAIHRFIQRLPRRARILRAGGEEEVDVESLTAGDLILVRAGERIAADGVIEDGCSTVDESSVTGESAPADKQPGDEVFSGSLNGAGALRVRVLRAGDDTTLARLVRLVQEARERRAPVERLADRAAKYFLPALLIAAALTFWWTRDWMRTVAVLIVACPCALILATPTAMVAAIGALARRGILARGGEVLQQAASVDTIVVDKTGTLTEASFEILEIIAVRGGEDDVLRLAAAVEAASDHPLARIIVDEAIRRRLSVPKAENARVLPGRGVECVIDGASVRAGNELLLGDVSSQCEPLLRRSDQLGATPVLVAVGDSLCGAVLLRDRIREGAKAAFARLDEIGIHRRIMLTGDRRRPAEAIAREAGIREIEAELLPHQKVERIGALRSQGRIVAMIGDGINDAPALAAADVGIAVAGASDITAEAADAVFLPHSLETLPALFEAARRAVATAWQNIILFAGVVNLAAVLCAATGVVGPIGAALTHQLSSFLVMMNSLRLLRTRPWFSGRVLPPAPVLLAARRVGTALASRRETLARWSVPAILAMFALNGFYVIGPNEIGIVQRFGKKLAPFSQPGLHYKLPWPVDRLTRIRAQQVRVVEIGFRSNASSRGSEPAAYEWNVQHRSGRFQRVPEESLALTGDQNLIEVNATVHYNVARPDDFLFGQADGDATVRAAANSVLQSTIASAPLDAVLTTGRVALEQKIRSELQARVDGYRAGVRILGFRLQDVHPSVEVVDAFRDVSGAFEEKNRLINEAEAYRNEQIALARGNARARLEQARAYTAGRTNRAAGDASRFSERETAFRLAPGPTETRLYLETIEQVLPGKKKLIIDRSKTPRRLFMLEDGVEFPGGLGFGPRLAGPDARP